MDNNMSDHTIYYKKIIEKETIGITTQKSLS